MPRCSIVIPCHNGGPYVGEAIASCLAQTASDLEVIVVDDGSIDETAGIVTRAQARDDRVRLITQSRQGVGAARNAGLRAADGDLVGFLDADDVLEPEKLAVQGKVLLENPDIDIVLCDGIVIDGDGREIWPSLVDARRLTGRPSLFDECFCGGPFPPLVPLLRRDLVLRVGGFEEDPLASGWADIDLWMRLSLAGARAHFVPDRLVRYRQTPTNMSSDRDAMERAAKFVYAKALREHPVEVVRALRVAHGRLRDQDYALAELRGLVADLIGERAVLAGQCDTLVRERRAWEGELERLRGAATEATEAVMVTLSGRVARQQRPLAIWGAGSAGRAVLACLRRREGDADFFVDSDPTKAGGHVDGLPVVPPAALTAVEYARAFVLVASVHAPAIEARLQELNRTKWRDYVVTSSHESAKGLTDSCPRPSSLAGAA